MHEIIKRQIGGFQVFINEVISFSQTLFLLVTNSRLIRNSGKVMADLKFRQEF
jgi:hypothetical protein